MSEEQTQQTHAEAIDDMYKNMRRRGNRYILMGFALLIFVTLGQYFFRSEPIPDFTKLGVHLLLDDGRNNWDVSLWDEHMTYAGELLPNEGYVVQVVRGDDLDPQKWQTFLDLCEEHKLTPIFRLATTYDLNANMWLAPEADEDGSYTTLAQEYVTFMNALNWYEFRPHFILLNEPNHGDEWGGKPDPVAYARYMRDVAMALQEANFRVRILNAAFDLFSPNTGEDTFVNGFYYMDAESFMDAMVAHDEDIFELINFWNSHSYPVGFASPPWEQNYGFDSYAPIERETPPSGIFNRGINGYEWELWKLEQYGITNKPVMITETGWKHAEAIDANSLDSVEGLPEAETAADYLELALVGNRNDDPIYPSSGWDAWLTDSRVIAVIPFALNGIPSEWSHTNWLQVSEEGEILGTYPIYDRVIELQGE